MDKEIQDAFEKMKKTESETASEPVGACIYNAGGKTQCAIVGESICRQLKGIFIPNKRCS
jgi:hypothetical protein